MMRAKGDVSRGHGALCRSVAQETRELAGLEHPHRPAPASLLHDLALGERGGEQGGDQLASQPRPALCKSNSEVS